MKKFKKIFYIIYFIFILSTFIVTVFYELFFNNLTYDFILNTLPKWIQIWVILGIVLMVTEWIMETIHIRRLKQRNLELEQSITSLKAKIFDQEEEIKSSHRVTNDPYQQNENQDSE